MHRRQFLRLGAGTATAAATLALAGSAQAATGLRALAFDAFPIFDPRSVAARAAEVVGERAEALLPVWRARQFEYQWLRALGGRYRDFWQTTADALSFASRSVGIPLSEAESSHLMNAFLELPCWPDVAPALSKLLERDLQIAFLSNMTEAMLKKNLERNEIAHAFDHVISTDRIQSFKPAPQAYQLGPEILGVRREEILFVPFAGWDLAGAGWFGYRTFWVNRLATPVEELDVAPDGSGSGLDDLVTHLSIG